MGVKIKLYTYLLTDTLLYYNIMNQFIQKSKNKFKDDYLYNNLNYITTKKPIQLTCSKNIIIILLLINHLLLII